MNSKLSMSLMTGVIVINSFLSVACSTETMGSEEVAQSAIHQSYSVTYDEATNTTSYWAQFRAGGSTGTTIALSSPSQVKTNQSKMSQSNFFGTYYSQSTRGFVPDASFEWVDLQEKSYVNSISMQPITVVEAAATISAKNSYEVKISTSQLSSQDSIDVVLSQELDRNNPNAPLLSARAAVDLKKGIAIFSPQELSKLRNGLAVLEVSRNRSGSLGQATAKGGHISSRYLAPRRNVNIQDSEIELKVAKN